MFGAERVMPGESLDGGLPPEGLWRKEGGPEKRRFRGECCESENLQKKSHNLRSESLKGNHLLGGEAGLVV